MEARFKIVDPSHPKFGKKITAIPNDEMQFVDVKTGDVYDISQLRKLEERHAVYCGLHIGRLALLAFAREYIKYHSFRFGIGFDTLRIPGTGDVVFDVELYVACFGVGIRFEWQKNID